MRRGPHGRYDRLIQEKRHDTYEGREKLPDGTACPQCGVLFTTGTWSWNAAIQPTRRALCPACRRILEKFPAGEVEIGGAFLDSHRREILNLVRNVEEREKKLHPMERIMDVIENGETVHVRTTGIHLARLIGESLSRSYKGALDFQYGTDEKSIRVNWRREG